MAFAVGRQNGDMFGRLYKQKSDRNGERERFDIHLSGFQAHKIPKGWDRLGLSLISVETGKTLNRTAKAVVWNGNCQWTETLSESVWMTRGDTSKDAEGCLFKIIVTSGSSRSNVLGEASINLANYVEASGSVPVSLQLNKCSYGTILQMKARCVTSNPKIRDEQVGTDFNSSFEELTIEYEELDRRSDGSENISAVLPRNFKSSPSQLRKSNSKESSFSASVSGNSFDSWEGNISDKDIGYNYSSGRQNSGGSQWSLVDDESVKPNGPSFSLKQRGSGLSFQNGELHQSSQPFTASPLCNAGSSKELIKAVEVTVEELRAEAKMWERNARKLMSDVDVLREELSERSEHQELLGSELSASREECESLRQENERINVSLEDLTRKQTAEENDAEEFRKALEEEIKFQKERNADLALQLKKTQDSNVELLSVLQEFEETIDTQRAEIDTLLSAKQTERRAVDSRVSELKDEIKEKEMLVFKETAALKSQLLRREVQMEVLVLNFALAYVDSAIYTFELSQNDRDESHEIEALKSRIEKSQLVETRDHTAEEGDITCKCFGGSHGEKTPVDGIVASSVSVDEFLITTTRLDTYNNDLEDRLSELEEENVCLSERIIGLEAHLRYLTNEKESTLLSLQNSECLCSRLENDVRKLESDMEVLGIDAKEKLLGFRERLSESQDESGHLKVANSKLRDESEVLIEKCGFLEKANKELKKENAELHEECAVLDAEVGELKELFRCVSTEIEVLEGNIASLREETALKEKAMRSEVDALLRENGRIHENIREESIRSSDTKTTGDVAITERNEEVLMAEREKLLDLLEDAKSNEKRLKCTVRRLNLTLKGSEYENLGLVGEKKSLELRLQLMESLRKEVSALRRGIGEAIFERERLEASNLVLLEQYEEMKSERESLVRKISSTQKALTEVEHSRNTKAALEEKVLRLEGDLTAREALIVHDAEQRNELARTRIANGELRRRIKSLQDENKRQKPAGKEYGVPSEYETLDRSLEKELGDLRESYSAMSLKYAQTEAQREQLLMRLKAI